MGKVKNIGMLDTREATENSLKGITEFENIGMLLYNDNSAHLINPIKKTNIGEAIKLRTDEKVDFSAMNGKCIIDRDFLEGLDNKILLAINGKCVVKDVSKELFNEKIYSILINGKVICPDHLRSSIQIKGKVNGIVVAYKRGYRFMDKTCILTENVIVRYAMGTNLSVSKLVAIGALDRETLGQHFDRIQVLDHIITTKENLDILREKVDDFDEVDMTIVPENSVYTEGNLELNNESVKRYFGKTIVADGRVNIRDISKETLINHLKGIHCDEVTCNEEICEVVRDLIINDAEVQIQSENTISNRGNLTITNDYLLGLSGQQIIENRGKMDFDESVSQEIVKEKIKHIDNRGKIIVDPSILSGVTINNRGVIKKREEEEKEKVTVEEDVIYQNMGTLVL